MTPHTRCFALRFLFAVAIASLLPLATASAKQHGKGAAPAGPSAAAPADEPRPAADLPGDANNASLRVNAIDMMYELDLSPHQLNAIRAAAVGTAQTTARSPAKATPQLLAALKDFQAALLDGKDDQQIAKLRNQVIDMAGGDDVHLDTDIVATAPARAKTADLCLKLKASQIVAFLATHAEEVVDPEETMISAAAELQDLRTEAGEKGGEGGTSPDGLIQETSFTVGYLVAGMDDARAHALTQRVADWLRAAGKLSGREFAQQRPTLEADARKIVGDVSPIQVLNHWLEQQMAVLLSNPQLQPAIGAMLKARTQGG